MFIGHAAIKHPSLFLNHNVFNAITHLIETTVSGNEAMDNGEAGSW